MIESIIYFDFEFDSSVEWPLLTSIVFEIPAVFAALENKEIIAFIIGKEKNTEYYESL